VVGLFSPIRQQSHWKLSGLQRLKSAPPLYDVLSMVIFSRILYLGLVYFYFLFRC